jgi:hypothetical protein
MLMEAYSNLLERGWQPVFAQARSHHRALQHALAGPCTLGRRTLSRTVCALGRSDQDWSADYKLFSRSGWEAEDLFDPVLDDYLGRYPQGPLPVAFDDTKLPKTGKKIPGAFWQRDPLSPPFHPNLMYGLRFVQACLLFPHHQEGDFSARGFPVRFQEAPTAKKPGKRASPEERKAYRALQKQHNLSTQTLAVIRGLRARLDEQGAPDRQLLAALDGSFCNQTLFKAELDRIELLARCRKDARLCFPAAPGSGRRYAPETFTPEEVRQDGSRPWKKTRIWFGGKRRAAKYKEIRGVLWRRGAGRRPLRLIVLAPVPYKLSQHSRTYYRRPAYLLTTDPSSSVKRLVQTYFDRWQIEVNHRDEKDLLGVGQAQLRSARSVPRHPAFVVASYSLLLLAGLRAFGPGRSPDYPHLPKWRRNARRASLLDLLTLLRQEVMAPHETSVSPVLQHNIAQNMLRYANT